MRFWMSASFRPSVIQADTVFFCDSSKFIIRWAPFGGENGRDSMEFLRGGPICAGRREVVGLNPVLHPVGEAMDGAAEIVNGVGLVNDVSNASELRLSGQGAGDFT